MLLDQKVSIEGRLGKEPWSPSALHTAQWPETDPSKASQMTVIWNESHIRCLWEAVENNGFNLTKFLDKTSGMPVAERIWSLLTDRAFNFNGASVRSETYWLDRIRHLVSQGAPIDIAYPLVCKIGNPAKRLSLVGITAGERAIVQFFKLLGEASSQIYGPGIRIHVLSDASLYNGALQIPPPSAAAYMLDFEKLIIEEMASPWVEMHDYTKLLAPFYREFETAYNREYALLGAPLDSTLQESSRSSLPTSIRASLNSRRLGLSYGELRNLFGPQQVNFEATRQVLDTQAIMALREQLAIKLACDELNLPDRIWPNNVRATCHRGSKHGRAVLGLRCYPEYYGRSKLLPYHGMPVIERDRKQLAKLSILPDVSLRSREDLTRVVNDRGEAVLYIEND